MPPRVEFSAARAAFEVARPGATRALGGGVETPRKLKPAPPLEPELKASGGGGLATAHRGLLMDKYFAAKARGEKKSVLGQWRALCEAGLTPPVYTTAYERWLAHTKSIEEAVRFTGAVRGRMAIGLGIESVHEGGCRLHATYGVPVIPGSSLKGLLRAGLTAMPAYREHVGALFGSDEPGKENKGSVDVFDGWWVPARGKSGLAPDVVTVHHKKYYGGGNAGPQDREAPVPNHFLTVTGEFYFSFLVHGGTEKWREFVSKAAQAFLSRDGIGAKRNSGYGRFGRFKAME